MPVLIDTNILLRLLEPTDPEYALVREAVEALTVRGESLCFASQNLVEFWSVCTRPISRNGLGLTPAQTDKRATLIESRFRLLPDNERVHAEWRRLVVAHSVAGAQVHDARLVAAMLAHGVPQLLTSTIGTSGGTPASRSSIRATLCRPHLAGKWQCSPRGICSA